MKTLLKIIVFSLITSATQLTQAQEATIETTWKSAINFIKENSKHIVSATEKEGYYQVLEIKNDTLILKQTKSGKPLKKVIIPLEMVERVYSYKRKIGLRFQQRSVAIYEFDHEINGYRKPYGTGSISFKICNESIHSNLLKIFKRIAFIVLQNEKAKNNFPEMIEVNGSIFTMGDLHDLGSNDELPLHKVTLSNFSIGKTEITVEQYKSYCIDTGVKMPKEPKWGWNTSEPIVNVSWKDAVNYCTWLSKKTNKNISLPTEAQWEYAAKGGEFDINRLYSGGSPGWHNINSNQKAHAVGLNKPNKLKLFDMSGNVAEWCLDWYDNKYYKNSPNNNNPINKQESTFKVIRGGHWFAHKTMCRISNRMHNKAKTKSSGIGFRVVSN
jgi:formylglycine-generating enzyme required for sulfatase activity